MHLQGLLYSELFESIKNNKRYAKIMEKTGSDQELIKYLYNISVCMFDECQRVSDRLMYGKVLKYIPNLKYSLGFSGTPFRNDSATLEMNALCGFVIYKKTTSELEKEGYLLQTKCYFIYNDLMQVFNTNMEYAEAYDQYIVDNEYRNRICVDILQKFKDKKCMILVRRIKHGEKLKLLLEDNGFKCEVINSTTKKDIRGDALYDFKDENDKDFILIASTKIMGTGINIPSLDCVINLSAHKSDIDSVQIVGRTKRKSEGKKCGYYIDFYDNLTYFKDAAKARMKILKTFGNEVFVVNNIDDI
jgi:superfamily II DNA or RNA helicase